MFACNCRVSNRKNKENIITSFFTDCKDGSDEAACSVDEDPNAAPRCDAAQCILPDCFCSADGTKVPGEIELTQVPQMITLSFNGAMNIDNLPIYQQIFSEDLLNPNGCSGINQSCPNIIALQKFCFNFLVCAVSFSEMKQ